MLGRAFMKESSELSVTAFRDTSRLYEAGYNISALIIKIFTSI